MPTPSSGPEENTDQVQGPVEPATLVEAAPEPGNEEVPGGTSTSISSSIRDHGSLPEKPLPPHQSARELLPKVKDEEEGEAHHRSSPKRPSKGVWSTYRSLNRTWLSEDIKSNDMVIPLLMISFSTAITDAVTFQAYKTFTVNQTGLTIILAIAAIGPSNGNLLTAGVSLASFLGFGLLFGQLGARIGHRKRIWILASLLSQVVILVIAAILVSPSGISSTREAGDAHAWVIVWLIASQGGIQLTMATNLGIPEIPTAMITAAYAGYLASPVAFSPSFSIKTIARDRRLAYLGVFWAGAFVGACIYRWAGVWVALVVGVGIKAGVMLFVFGCRGDVGD